MLSAFVAQSIPESAPQVTGEIQAIDPLTNLTIEASPRRSNPGQEVTFFVNVTSDVPNSTISILIRFDDRIPPFTNNSASPIAFNVTGNPARVVQKFTYNHTGNFSDTSDLLHTRYYFYVRAFAQDNASGTVSTRVQYYVNNNSAPEIPAITPAANPAPGTPVNFSLEVKDYDNDVLTVTWNFSDGTSAVDTIVTNYLSGFSNKIHQWNVTSTPYVSGYWVNLTVNVTVYDGQGHWANRSIPVTIWVPVNYGPSASMTVSATETDPKDPVTFYASAIDREGDGIYWYFDFGDNKTFSAYTGPTEANTTVWNNQTHLFPETEGNATYTAMLHVTDGPADHNSSSGIVNVTVVINLPPGVGLINTDPQTLEFNVTIGYLNVTFSVQMGEPEAENLTVTWDMGDGSALRTNSTIGAIDGRGTFTFRQWKNFTAPAIIKVVVTATDGREGHLVTRYLNTTLRSTNNPPMLTQAPTFKLGFGDAARPNETLNFTMKVSDAEFDNLTIVWDFGDGGPIKVLHFNRTDYAGPNITCKVSHAYSKVGTYQIRIWITDNEMLGYGQHNVTVNVTVTVKEAEIRVVAHWDWWDYTSLGLFMMIPVSIGIYTLIVMNRRRRLDKEGINWDEYRTKKEVGLEEEL